MNEKARIRVSNMTLMSDVLFNAFMNENIECMEYVLRIIMDKEDLQVMRVEIQHSVPNPFSRGVRYDVFAKDDQGNDYDIEVQQADSGAVPKRGRYNSSMMDYMSLDKNQDWDSLPKTYVIFITENDVLGGDLPIYHINRRIDEMNGALYGDESQIIYVNGAYRVKDGEAKTALTSLIDDFHCVNPDDMDSQLLADRMRQIKNSEEEMSNMCKAMEEYAAEKLAEEKKATIIGLIKEGFNIEGIARAVKMSVDQVTAIGKQASLL